MSRKSLGRVFGSGAVPDPREPVDVRVVRPVPSPVLAPRGAEEAAGALGRRRAVCGAEPAQQPRHGGVEGGGEEAVQVELVHSRVGAKGLVQVEHRLEECLGGVSEVSRRCLGGVSEVSRKCLGGVSEVSHNAS